MHAQEYRPSRSNGKSDIAPNLHSPTANRTSTSKFNPAQPNRVRVAFADDPYLDPAVPYAARSVEARLLDQYCASPDSWCCWAGNARICNETGLTPYQLRYGLRCLKCLPQTLQAESEETEETGKRIYVFTNYDDFESWLKGYGTPVHGLSHPKGMRSRPGRVIVFIRRLPTMRADQKEHGPMKLKPGTTASPLGEGLPCETGEGLPPPTERLNSSGTEERERNVQRCEQRFFSNSREEDKTGSRTPLQVSPALEAPNARPRLSDSATIVVDTLETDSSPTPEQAAYAEAMERYRDEVTKYRADQASQAKAIASHLDSLPEAERDEMRARILYRDPIAGPEKLRTAMLNITQSRNPALFPEIVPPRRPVPPSPAVVPPTPVLTSRPKPVRAFRPSTKDNADLRSLAKSLSGSPDSEAPSAFARLAAHVFGDRDVDRSVKTYRGLAHDVQNGSLPESVLYEALMEALKPGTKNRGARFIHTVKRLKAESFSRRTAATSSTN